MSQLAPGETGTAAQPPMVIEGPTSTAVAVRRQALPKELSALGVQAAVDAESGMQILIIPKQLRETANVLMPVQSFQQADPNWTPSLRVVELDPSKDGPHFYSQQGKLAPRKQALELLADAAGVVEVSTSLGGRERVEVGDMMAETFTHIAILRIRKSDGTLRTLQASRTYEPYAEYEEIKASANTKGPADLRKKWLNEIKFAKAKNESKAVNRAMRAALQIGHSFTAAEAAKPFVVVGWNLAPQDTQAVQAAIASLYGASADISPPALPPATDWPEPEDVPGEVLQDDASEASSQQAPVEAATPQADTGAPGAQDPQGSPDGVAVTADAAAPEAEREPPGTGDQEQEASLQSPPAPSTPEPEIPGVTPAAPSATTEAGLAAALAVKIPSGSYQGRSLGWVLELGEPADEWLSYALRQPWPHDQTFKVALAVAVRAHRPEMHAAWLGEQS